MSRSRKPTPDELELWRSIVETVEPLPGREVDDEPPAPSPPQAAEPAKPVPVRRIIRDAPLPIGAPTLPQLAPGQSPGVDRRTADRLRRGRLAIDGRIDLHGKTRAEAQDALAGFVARSHRQGRRTVLVITGKGGAGDRVGVLRAEVPRWLNEPPIREKVLAFHPARPKDGGAGALYVLLKRHRKTD